MVVIYCRDFFLIHSADPQSRSVVIIVFVGAVRPSVPTFQNLAEQNKIQLKTMLTTGDTVGVAEWIIDDTWLVLSFFVTIGNGIEKLGWYFRPTTFFPFQDKLPDKGYREKADVIIQRWAEVFRQTVKKTAPPL